MPVNSTVVRIAELARATSGTATLTAPIHTGERGLGSERTAAGKRAILSVFRNLDAAIGTDGGTPAVEGSVAIYGADLTNPNTGAPLGNAFAASVTPTVFPFLGDGTTKEFQTNIPFAAFSNNNWIVDLPAFKLGGTFAVAASGVVAGTSGVAGQSKLGDKVMINGHVGVITAYTDENTFTITPAPAAAITAGKVGYNLSPDRRFKTWITSGSIGTTNPELFTVTDVGGFAKLAFAVAPPALVGPAAATTLATGTVPDVPAIYKVTPTEILAATTAAVVRAGVRSRSVMWAACTHTAGNDLSAVLALLEHATE